MINRVAKLMKVLNSETDPAQISLAVCFAMIIGLTPLYSLHNLLFLFIVLLLRVNLAAFILGWLFFSGVAYILDPLFHRIGLAILTAKTFETIWTALYNITIFRLANFNNSIVMGSLIVSLILFVPIFLLSNMLINKYRDHILAWVRKTRIMQILKGSKLFQAYEAVSGWGE
ncbi:MAG: TIGR03546 family protein [Deltaproteobacteria bacterium]|nr:MAG: TIGR03546 family protein [Deltaproteobacteria bacterium]